MPAQEPFSASDTPVHIHVRWAREDLGIRDPGMALDPSVSIAVENKTEAGIVTDWLASHWVVADGQRRYFQSVTCFGSAASAPVPVSLAIAYIEGACSTWGDV